MRENNYNSYMSEEFVISSPLNFEEFSMISGLKIWFPWVHFVAALPELVFSFGLMFILIYLCLTEFTLLIVKVYDILIKLLVFVLFFQLFNPYVSPFVFDLYNIYLKFEFLQEWQVFFLFNKNMIIDYYVIMLKLVILIVAICFLHIFKFYTKSTVLIEYPILICFLIFGLLLLVQSFDLVLMYLSLELVALTSYILSAFARKYVESLEAGIKYLILGSVASGFLLLGVSFLYGVTGCTDFYNLKIYFAFLVDLFLSAENFTINVNNVNIFDQNEVSPAIFSFVDIPTGIGVFKINLGVILGFLLINFGFLFKLSAAPFHMWTPDVYEGSPLFTTILYLTVVKIAIFGIYLRLVYFLFYDFFILYMQPLLLFCGILSIIWGSFAGLGQTRIKRLFAYSGIVNTGFILVGLVEGTLLYSTHSVYIYISFYFMVTIGVFIFFLSTRNEMSGESIDFFVDLRGFAVRFPWIALSFAILVLSLAGVPPFIGFLGKLGIFISLLSTPYAWFIIPVILGSVISSFYYLRIIKIMFFDLSLYLNRFSFFFVTNTIMFVYLIIVFLVFAFFFTPSVFYYFFNYDLLEFSLFIKWII